MRIIGVHSTASKWRPGDEPAAVEVQLTLQHTYGQSQGWPCLTDKAASLEELDRHAALLKQSIDKAVLEAKQTLMRQSQKIRDAALSQQEA